MRIVNIMFALLLIALTACSTTNAPQAHKTHPAQLDPPETVMVTYHVKGVTQAVFQDALARAWVIYRKQNLVFAEPHTIIQELDTTGKPSIVEIFTWVNHAAPGKVPDSVKQIWAQMQGLCEPRNGHAGIEGGEVVLLAPRNR